jgi:hypothetical protein
LLASSETLKLESDALAASAGSARSARKGAGRRGVMEPLMLG